MKTYSLMVCLLFNAYIIKAQTVTQIEYFLDTDDGFGKNTIVNVTPSVDGTFPLNLNIRGAAAGVHKLYMRTKDSDGRWSHTARRTIEVLKTSAENVITTGEYFFDTQPGFNQATPIIVVAQDTAILQHYTATVSGLEPGYHQFYGRFQDLYGNWSQTFRRTIEIIKDTSGGKVMVVEYFFDTDLGFGNCASVAFATPAKDGSFTFTIPQNQIPPTDYNLHYRVRDSGNYNWSLTQWIDKTTLPLTFLKFSATKEKNNARLNWTTTNEVNTSHFNIQRSRDAAYFTTVGRVNAKGEFGENRYEALNDISGISTGKIYYRLEQADKDGKISYSKIATLITESTTAYRVTPNPAKDFFTVSTIGNNITDKAQLVVTDLAGHRLIQQKLTTNTPQRVYVQGLAKGIYIVKIISAASVFTQKLLVE